MTAVEVKSVLFVLLWFVVGAELLNVLADLLVHIFKLG
jgi:hypothetical protein